MTSLHSRNSSLGLGAMPDSARAFVQNVRGCWLFDEGAGDAVLDSGFYGRHGTLVGGVKRTAGPALEFDGVTGYASIPHSLSLTPARITVIVCTRNLVAPAQYETFLIKSTDANWGDGYGMFYDSPTLMKFWVTHYNNGGVAQITVDPLAKNTVVATYDGSQVRICVNGVAGTMMVYPSGILPGTGPLEFGRGRADSFNINGLIYQVTILDYALAPEDALRASQQL